MRRSRVPSVQPHSTDRSAKQLGFAVLLLLVTILVGTFGYVLIEEWSIGDALYMTVISLTTTGFGEVRPLSPAGRGLTVFVIISGIASLAYLGGRLLQLAVEMYLLRRGRMDREIQRLKNHVILCGYGRMGRHIANDLSEARVPFVVLESDPQMATVLEEHGYLHMIGDASSDELLKAAGVERARGLIAVVSSDAENVYTTLTAKSINPEVTIVARALTDESAPKLRTAGADRVIKPYEMVGRRIAQLVIRPAMVEFVDTIARSNSGEITMEEMTVSKDSTLIDVALRDTPIRSRLNVIIVAIRRGEDDLVYNPGPDAHFEVGDRLVAIGRSEQLAELSVLCGIEAG
ncbi:MAG TPA: potassium channel protein [Spirochaetia bacterium]|nr:potassium channel protein [Spirochaetia bacterium]